MKRADLFASAFLTVLAAAASVGAYRLGLGDVHNPGSGFMPFATATLLALMAFGQLVRVALTTGGQAAGGSAFAQSRWTVVLSVLGALVGFGLVLDTAGFTIAMFLMMVVLFGPVAGKRWWVALLSALLIVVIVRVASRALGMQFPEGPLGL